MSRLTALCVITLLLAGCVSRSALTLRDLPLPAQAEGACCWQATQSLHIVYDGQEQRLMAVAAVEQDALSLVFLDPMGRRVLSIHQQNGKIESYRVPELPKELPETFLLALFYFSWWPQSSWDLSGKWHIEFSENNRVLTYKGKPMVSVEYPKESRYGRSGRMPKVGESITLKHHQKTFTMTIRTEHWQSL